MNEDLSSSNTKTPDHHDSPEESSWTFYMQDFGCDGDNKKSSFSSGYETSNSLVSDAASSAAAMKLASNNNNNNNDTVLFASERSNNGNRLSFKRPRKAKGAAVSNDLEDTASSPVNSPKISYMNQLTQKQNESNNKNVSDFNNLQGHHANSSHNHNHNGLDILEGDIESSELKKKGLCLVPVSMLAKYFG